MHIFPISNRTNAESVFLRFLNVHICSPPSDMLLSQNFPIANNKFQQKFLNSTFLKLASISDSSQKTETWGFLQYL